MIVIFFILTRSESIHFQIDKSIYILLLSFDPFKRSLFYCSIFYSEKEEKY